jgi:hypothetical protein
VWGWVGGGEREARGEAGGEVGLVGATCTRSEGRDGGKCDDVLNSALGEGVRDMRGDE